MADWRRMAAALLMGLCAGLWGCGYTTDALQRSDIDTVHVPVFENRTFRRGLEMELTRAVIDELNVRTRLRVVPREQADSLLVGSVRDLKETVITKTPEDDILEEEITVYVSFKWVDLRTGQPIVRRDDLRATADLILPTATVDATSRRAFQEAARKIVNLMESDW